MKMDNDYKNELTKIYRTELFETDGVNIGEIDSLISDEDLKAIIKLNNMDMCLLINQKPIDKELVQRLFRANVNFYRLAKHRELNIPGSSVLMGIASTIGYNVDKLYSELNVGAYYRAHRPR